MTKHLPEDVRRRQILDAARRCFIENGYFPTRMEDIAEMAKLSKGGIYFHFESKQQIFEALVRQEYEESSALLKNTFGQPGTYIEIFGRLAKYFVDLFTTRPDYPRFAMVMAEMAGRDQTIRNMLAQLHTDYIKTLSQFLQKGIENGMVQPVDTEIAAAMLKGMSDALQSNIVLGISYNFERMFPTFVSIMSQGLFKPGAFDESRPGTNQPAGG